MADDRGSIHGRDRRPGPRWRPDGRWASDTIIGLEATHSTMSHRS